MYSQIANMKSYLLFHYQNIVKKFSDSPFLCGVFDSKVANPLCDTIVDFGKVCFKKRDYCITQSI
jgi:hypothetical protein